MPTFPVFTEQPTRAGYFVVGEPGPLSREQAVVAAGQDLLPGAVVGKVTDGGKLVAWTAAAEDGSEDVYGVLFDAADATDGDVRQVVLVRDCEVNFGELRWAAGVTSNDKAAARVQLAALGIISRDTNPA